jgi:chemotaxis protein MotB
MTRADHTRGIEVRSWQMSFNDLLTVLLTFFILLVSASDISLNKVQDLSSSVAEVFGPAKNEDQRTLLIRAIGHADGIEARAVEGGVSIVLPESVVYPSGSAEILHKDILGAVGEKLKKAAGSILVEGHTDSIPVTNGSFPSNWELSAMRAVNVVKFLVDECGIDPRNLSAAGYADSRPVASNESSEGRARNRRVSLIVSLK